ncbi:MAG TPA: GYF domain-containing protein [Polyangia bacterium]|nr:GYF domain-containing protein [Polyangia bacterium]
MKIVCDSCGTKYSISDDKVRGKVFKIRCKKCSHIIVVRGQEGGSGVAAAPTAPEPAAAAAEGGGWHLVVDGDQVGPISDADVRARIERGEINAETYVWKEGFADWLKLSAIPDFAHLVQPGEAGVFADGTGSGAVNGSAEAPAANGGGLFGAASAAPASDESDVFASPAPAARASGGDLFASSVAAKPAASSWPAPSAAAAPHDGGRVENLTGQRHENSVLFSLSNLQSLATAAPASKPLSTTAPTAEGSGLIDIRAMAASTLGTSPSSGPSFGGGGGDDLPAFGTFAPAQPVLLALPTESGPPKWIYPVIGVAILAVGAIGVMAYKILAKPVAPEAAPVAATAPAPAEAAKPSAPVAANTPPAEAAKPTTIAEDKLPPREEPKAAEAKSEAKAEKGEHHKHGEKAAKGGDADKGDKGSKDSGKSAKPAAAAAAAAPETPKPAKGSLDDLLEGALNHKPAPAARPHVSDDDSPRKSDSGGGSGPLAKGAVVAGMNSVKGKVSDCYSQFKVPGMAMVNVVIGKNGHVSSATVTGKFAGTPTGSCVEKAVKSASFPPSDGLTTPYPFQLK